MLVPIQHDRRAVSVSTKPSVPATGDDDPALNGSTARLPLSETSASDPVATAGASGPLTAGTLDGFDGFTERRPDGPELAWLELRKHASQASTRRSASSRAPHISEAYRRAASRPTEATRRRAALVPGKVQPLPSGHPLQWCAVPQSWLRAPRAAPRRAPRRGSADRSQPSGLPARPGSPDGAGARRQFDGEIPRPLYGRIPTSGG